jgi:hypothetical protein
LSEVIKKKILDMDIFSVLLILFVLVGAFFLVKIKMDQGILTEREIKEFTDSPIKTSSYKSCKQK